MSSMSLHLKCNPACPGLRCLFDLDSSYTYHWPRHGLVLTVAGGRFFFSFSLFSCCKQNNKVLRNTEQEGGECT